MYILNHINPWPSKQLVDKASLWGIEHDNLMLEKKRKCEINEQ
jgi:hypothetical protein